MTDPEQRRRELESALDLRGYDLISVMPIRARLRLNGHHVYAGSEEQLWTRVEAYEAELASRRRA